MFLLRVLSILVLLHTDVLSSCLFVCVCVGVCVSTALCLFSWRLAQRGIGKCGPTVIYQCLIATIYGQTGHRGPEPVLITNNE